MDETLDGNLQGVVLEMLWGLDGDPLVEFDVAVDVLSPDQVEPELGDAGVEHSWEMVPHHPQDLVDYHSY